MKINKILKLILIITFFLIINNNFCENISIENINYDDSYTYNYFNNILSKNTLIIKQLNKNNIEYLNNSLDNYKLMEKTKKEINYYKSKNITVPATYIIEPFYNLSKNINELCILNYNLEQEYNKNTENNLIKIQKSKIISYQINNTLSKIYVNLDSIDNISNLKKDNKTLYFDTTNIRKELNRNYKKYIIKNNEINEKFEKIKDKINENKFLIFVEVTNKNPYLNENTTIIIYDLTNKSIPINIHIGGEIYNKHLKNNISYILYRFKTEGYYEIYATKKINNETIKSNTVIVNSLKVPTKIIGESNYNQYIDKPITVSGIVVDNNNNKINGNILIYFNNNKNYKTYNLDNGEFNIFLKEKSPKIINLNIVYPGNTIYKKSQKNISVNFLKYPIYIKLNKLDKEIYVNEPYLLSGYIKPYNIDNKTYLNKTYNLTIYLNNTPYKNITVNNNFSVNISINNSGNYTIYAQYNGDELYKTSKSNILNINVINKDNYLIGYIIVIIFIFIIIAIYLIKNKKNIKIEKDKEDKEDNEIKENLGMDDNPNNNNNNNKNTEYNEYIENIDKLEIDEAYKLVSNKLINKYGFPKNITPRMLLDKIKTKNPNIFKDMGYITEIHEKLVYGKENIKETTKYIFFEKIEKIIGELNE